MRTTSSIRYLLGLLLVSVMGAGGIGCGAAGEGDLQDQQSVAHTSSAALLVCPNPKSCGGWSTWYNEGGPFCQSSVASCQIEICVPCHCNQDSCQECCHTRAGSATEQLQQSFRECTLQNGQPCRETQEQLIVVKCGC